MLQYGHIAAHLSSLGLQINNLTIRMPTLGDLVKKSIVFFPQIKLFDQISHCMQSKWLDYQFLIFGKIIIFFSVKNKPFFDLKI